MKWRPARVLEIHRETPTATTIRLDVPEWAGALAGQHIDVRLTAEDGYTAVRSYSLASAPGSPHPEITVEELPDGEVSPYLVHTLGVGHFIEVRGPIGGYFVWRGDEHRPIQLIGGGSGVVPLYSILTTHRTQTPTDPVRLALSARTPRDVYYREVLDADPDVTVVYTRESPSGQAGRLTTERLASLVLPPQDTLAYVCGPTGFVETMSAWLVDLGYDPTLVRTERFGGV